VPRLDATRIGVWRDLRLTVDAIARRIDDDLRAEWDISLGWFDVLSSLQRFGGRARPLDVAADLRLPASSISRRLDRLEEEGWIARHRHAESSDLRAVDVELTRTGRRLWREMNVSFRRSLQAHFAVNLDEPDIESLRSILELLGDDDARAADPVQTVGETGRTAAPA
jgi:DNA-binding MarR family transcriptional regulator